MFQVRIHGRGGQGVVSGAELMSVAAFHEGRHAQAFPSFGSERMGAPVMAFCRVDDKPIRLREPVLDPNAVIVQDPSLLHHIDVFAGLRSRGFILVNSTRDFAELGLTRLIHGMQQYHVRTLAATEIALKHVGRAVPNVPLLAGLAAMTRVVGIEALAAAIRAKFPDALAERNLRAAMEAYDIVLAQAEDVHA
ncbi:MAG TPA: 2-oxoacid:acceptor oxidoreductase family protein [Casimicrobiaceae bacterium]|nr:2-oxoacid:acceptor oxidoreductase family protein [Casimicrobiaceae bacterium]